ncbi:MAG: inositol monophosphatase, partial [Pseudonocardia sp.]|nr:inositol monophosphatase [Pseudonocardia sp.]
MTVQQHPRAPTSPPTVEPGLLSRALEVAGRLANDAAEVITATAGRDHQTGAGHKANPFDWVTDTDRTLERHTRRVLAAEFPGTPVVGEEYGADAGVEGA